MIPFLLGWFFYAMFATFEYLRWDLASVVCVFAMMVAFTWRWS